MPDHTEEDYNDLEKKNASLEEKVKTTMADSVKTKAALDEIKKKGDGEKDTVKDLQAKLQANEDDMKEQKDKLQAMEDKDKTREETEKHEMATKIANYDLQSEKINDSEVDDKIKALKKNDSNVLQAMLPYAKGEAEKHKEAKQSKQAAMGLSGKPRYEMDDQNPDTATKQAAEVNDFLKSYRSGLY